MESAPGFLQELLGERSARELARLARWSCSKVGRSQREDEADSGEGREVVRELPEAALEHAALPGPEPALPTSSILRASKCPPSIVEVGVHGVFPTPTPTPLSQGLKCLLNKSGRGGC